MSVKSKIEKATRLNPAVFNRRDDWAEVRPIAGGGFEAKFWTGNRDEHRDSIGTAEGGDIAEAVTIVEEWLTEGRWEGDKYIPGGMGKKARRGIGATKRASSKRGADGMSIRYLPVNQAYALMWMDQVLRIFNSRTDAEYELAELRRKSSAPNGGTMAGKRGMAANGDAADQDAARELEIFIHNDADLYRQQFQPIQKNLITKKARGVYDHEKAVKLFMYLMESGAKKYAVEFGNGRTDPGEWHRTFSKPTREAAARIFVEEFETEAGYGNYDNYLPKKYQKKAGMGRKRRGMGAAYAPLAALPADLQPKVETQMQASGKNPGEYVYRLLCKRGKSGIECKRIE